MRRTKGKSALVLAGGGIMGAAYEIGSLAALDRLFAPGFSTRRFDTYLGVSAGSIIAALIANRIAPADLYTAIAGNEQNLLNWQRRDIYRFDLRKLFGSSWRVLRNIFRILGYHRRNHWRFSLHEFFYILQEQFPAGIYSLDPMEHYLRRAFASEGLSNLFEELNCELLIPAYDLDRGQRTVFSRDDDLDCTISQAITASSAIPYFFQPYRINGNDYLDGSTGRVLHLDLAIEAGAKLLVVINPRTPMDNSSDHACLPSLSYGHCARIAELGISFTLEQARRIEAKEKLDLALENFRRCHPKVDLVVIEPEVNESLLFFQNPMSFRARSQVMAYGYSLTLNALRSRYDELEPIFRRHGITLTAERLGAPPPAPISGL